MEVSIININYMRLEEYVNNHFNSLNETEKSIIKFIVQNEKQVVNMSLSDLSKKCLVSQSSIFRLTKKLGFSGFNQFKFTVEEDLSNSNNVHNQKNNFIDLTSKTVNNLFKQFRTQQMNSIYNSIYNAGDIYVYPTGWEQEIIAEQLKRNFFLLGINIYVLPSAPNELEMISERFKKDDLVILISFSGDNLSLIKSAEKLNLKGIETLSVTSFKQNKLASISDLNFYYNTVEVPSDQSRTKLVFFTSLYVLMDLFTMGYSSYRDRLNNKMRKE